MVRNYRKKRRPVQTVEYSHKKQREQAILIADQLNEIHRLKGVISTLNEQIDSPHVLNFLEAVKLEAAHQRKRWPAPHDDMKADEDWLFLIGYLGGKAVQAGKTAAQCINVDVTEGHIEKRLHHIITVAAVCLNWHRHHVGHP